MPQINSWVEISRSALINNLKIFKKIIGPRVALMPVVKSNAYGHGLLEVSRICDGQPEVERLCTVNLAEALWLRKNKIKKPILVLSFYDLIEEDIKLAIRQKIVLTVYNEEQINFLDKMAGQLKQKAKIQFKIDTGTSRLGLPVKQALVFINKILKKEHLRLEGIFTHYAAAEEPEQSFTVKQTENFYELIRKLEEKKIFLPLKHAACSAGILMDNFYHFDAVRLGISLYGLWSLENGNQIRKYLDLKPVLAWKTKIIQLKNLEAGDTIGYGRTHRVARKTRLAVLSVGYWDGYDRKLSNFGQVLIKGKRCKVLGRVCMNLIMVDVTGLSVKVGEEAVLIGRQGREEITADELAEKLNTINYEVVTGINPLLPRKIVK
jgi:alanine racemase